jgi:NAD(P)-dependent dehydrogenase (short-subunit alcohol dehydrogenase family)
MPKQLEGKTALITGGSRGIGRAIAIALAAKGAKAAIGYVENEARAREVVDTIANNGGTAVAIRADLSDRNGVIGLFDEAQRSLGKLDIVVANAASIVVKPLLECTEQDYDRIFDTNTKSVFFTLQEAARRLNAAAASSSRRLAARACSSPASRSISAARVRSSSSCVPCRGSSARDVSPSTRSHPVRLKPT